MYIGIAQDLQAKYDSPTTGSYGIISHLRMCTRRWMYVHAYIHTYSKSFYIYLCPYRKWKNKNLIWKHTERKKRRKWASQPLETAKYATLLHIIITNLLYFCYVRTYLAPSSIQWLCSKAWQHEKRRITKGIICMYACNTYVLTYVHTYLLVFIIGIIGRKKALLFYNGTFL